VIARSAAGSGGFGYDPIFFVPSEGKTAAELSREEKSAISHRGRALKLLLEALRNG
jgi:XTP/dITP diphosphohydrolase